MTAISIPASGNWVGNDGPWSSFPLQIGRPAQVVEVLAATSKSNIWPVLPDWCERIADVGDCAQFRGGLYNPQNSSTFQRFETTEPYVELPFDPEQSLGYNGTAVAGTDLVGFGWPDSGGQTLLEQAITAFAYTTPFLAAGLLGLSSQPLNVSNATDSYSSPLSSLLNTSVTSSLSWGYNAGARYLDPTVSASLTFGGYDVGRGGELEDSDVALQVPMQNDEFVVAVQAVSFDDGAPQALDDGIDAYVDSVVPELWLPETACKVFEEAFDLQWNDTYQLYLLEDSSIQRLASVDKKVNLTLADPSDSSKTIVISLAYAAFVATARYPLAGIADDSAVSYFPLKRANESTRYYLGHTFLQEAYLAADYHRGQFYISQANLLSTESSEFDLKTIYPPGHDKGLSKGAVAGIAVAIVAVALILAGLAAWFLWRPRWKRRRNSRFLARIEAENAGLPDTQIPSPPPHETEMQEFYAKRPLSPESEKQELDATKTARGSIGTRAELESPGQSEHGSPRGKIGPRRQSYGFPASPAELEGRSPRMLHSRTASNSSVEPMSPLSEGGRRTKLESTTEEVHEMP